jgi:hypothetical protein
MNKDYLQNLRYKLQRRVRTLKSTNSHLYIHALKRLWNFMLNQDLIHSILIDLENRYIEVEEYAKVYCNINANKYSTFDTELENIALSYFIIKQIICDENLYKIDNIAARIGFKFIGKIDFEKGFTAFNDYVIDNIYDYIDECIDDQKAIINYIIRYKHKCEWFQAKNLYSLWEDNQNIGEKVLQKNLYEYLFEQGIDFSIEPLSASGEIDLIENQKDDNRLLAEVKIFNPEKSKSREYIAKGFRQLYDYTLNYNEPFGYLVVFKTCEEDLKFSLKNEDKFINYIIHNNKTIFFVVIDIFNYEKTASQRGKLKSIEITEEFLVENISNEKSIEVTE